MLQLSYSGYTPQAELAGVKAQGMGSMLVGLHLLRCRRQYHYGWGWH